MSRKYSTQSATVRMACSVCAAVVENDPQTIATILHDGLSTENDLNDSRRRLGIIFGTVPVTVTEYPTPAFVALNCEVCHGTTGDDESAYILVGIDH